MKKHILSKEETMKQTESQKKDHELLEENLNGNQLYSINFILDQSAIEFENNEELEEHTPEEDTLENIFEKLWGYLKKKMDNILSTIV